MLKGSSILSIQQMMGDFLLYHLYRPHYFPSIHYTRFKDRHFSFIYSHSCNIFYTAIPPP